MKLIHVDVRVTIAAVILLIGLPAFGTIGFAEWETWHHYAPNIELWRGHSDLCGDFEHIDCMSFGPGDANLYFDQISLFDSLQPDLAIVHTHRDSPWVLYDFSKKEIVRTAQTYEELGHTKVVGVEELSKFFPETWASRGLRYAWSAAIWGFYLVPVLISGAALVLIWWIIRFSARRLLGR